MPDTYIGFIDVGFLRAEGAKALDRRATDVELNAASVVDWLVNSVETRHETFLRAYWYDGAFDPSHSKYRGQRRELNKICEDSRSTVAARTYHGVSIKDKESYIACAAKYCIRVGHRSR